MLTTVEPNLDTLGQAIERKLLNELPVAPVEKYAPLLDLKNLQGESTGYIRVVAGDRIEKGSSLSIRIAPGMRYFNIHIIPKAEFKAPRYIFEGMLSTHGSQISVDLFPDVDKELDVDWLIDDFGAVTEIYNEALADDRFRFRSSRYMHMRAFQSPFFLCADIAPDADLTPMEDYAMRYFDEWRRLLDAAKQLGPDDAAARRARRNHMSHTIIQQDPDRHMVVSVYGESVTQAIEDASML